MFFKSSKYTKIGPYGLIALLLITVAVILRLILISNGWPLTNSDEGVWGLQALHILTRGERPIFIYGQAYMGTIESYLGAFFFLLFGPSLFALRLGLVVMYAGFLLALYLLARLLYTKGVALATLFLLCWGSSNTLVEQLTVTGEAFETLFFGTLSLLLASWLALSFHPDTSSTEQRKRFVVYGCLGCVIGLGLWSHLLVLPFVCTSLLLLLLFCHCELRTQACLFAILGYMLGSFPLILYPHYSPLMVLWHMFRTGGVPLTAGDNLWTSILGTVLITIPKATGVDQLCPIAVEAAGQWLHHFSLSCMGFQGSWGLGVVMVWTLAIFAVIKELREQCQALSSLGSSAEKEHLVRCASRLMLLASAGLTVLAYMASVRSAIYPVSTSRYLVGLSVATPTIVAFLWPRGRDTQRAHSKSGPYITGDRVPFGYKLSAMVPLGFGLPGNSLPIGKGSIYWVVDMIKIGIMCFISIILILGTANAFHQIPDIQKLIQRQNTLINDLLSMHAPHIYSDYWTCNRLIFLSNERIICSALNADLSQGYNRYEPYAQIVQQDHHPAYVFDIENGADDTQNLVFEDDNTQDIAFEDGIFQNQIFAKRFGAQYHRLYCAGYAVYLPATHIPS